MDLVSPSVEYFASFQTSLAEWGGAHQDGAGIQNLAALTSPDGFADWVGGLLAQELAPAAPGLVRCSYWWLAEDGEYVGSIALRHELNDYLAAFGGHVGYSVRPSARGRGLAGQALSQVVQRAAQRGIDRLLLTCADHNHASQRVIERAGGQLENLTDDGQTILRRYWITTSGRWSQGGSPTSAAQPEGTAA